MSVALFAPDYDSAAAALLAVNHYAGARHGDLIGYLNASAGMAGDDSTSTDFARSYDKEAQAAIDAIFDFVDASGNLAVLTATSIENHRKGNAAAVYTAPPIVLDGCMVPVGAGEVDVKPYTVPTSEGGDDGGLPDLLDEIIDRVQGVVWPNANTTTLRLVAKGWLEQAEAFEGLDDDCLTAIGHLKAQRSPEIPLAINAVTDLRNGASDLASACRSLAEACEEYADQVDHHRDLIKDVLKDLAIEAGITAGIGIALSVFTFGGSAAGAAGIIAARAATYGARIISILNKLKALVKVGAIAKLASAGEKVRKAALVLKRLATKTGRGRRSLGRPLQRGDLNPKQLANLKRYKKKLPAAAEDVTISGGRGGDVVLSAKVPGQVPGSYAIYEKTVDAAGETVSYFKTTVLPDGSILHVKDKLKR